MDWLTKELKIEIKKTFESRYQRKFSNEEVFEVARNLTNFLEPLIKLDNSYKNLTLSKRRAKWERTQLLNGCLDGRLEQSDPFSLSTPRRPFKL